jgi:hypothetical protein
MTIAKFARYLPIAGVLVMSGAAHAQSASQIIDSWASGMAAAVELPAVERERRMKTLTGSAQTALATVACTAEQDATDTTALVTKAKDANQLPITYTYKPSCDLKTKKMKVTFTLDSVAKDLPQDKLDAASLERIKKAVADWGTAAKKAVDQTRDPKKAKADVDSATAAAKTAISTIPCRPLAPPDIKDMVDQEVKKQGLDMALDVSGGCDAQKRTVTVTFVVNAIKLPSEAATDKPINVMVENAEPSADELKKMGLAAKDIVLSVAALDLAAGAATPVTISLPAKQKNAISLKPVTGGNFKVKLDVSFRGKKCIENFQLSGSARQTIRVTLKAISPPAATSPTAATCEVSL